MFRNIADNPLLLIVLLLIVVVVFGANKLPTAARSLGRSMRIFKSEVTALREDDDESPAANTGTARDTTPRDTTNRDASSTDATTDGGSRPIRRAPEAVEGRIVDPPDGTSR